MEILSALVGILSQLVSPLLGLCLAELSDILNRSNTT